MESTRSGEPGQQSPSELHCGCPENTGFLGAQGSIHGQVASSSSLNGKLLPQEPERFVSDRGCCTADFVLYSGTVQQSAPTQGHVCPVTPSEDSNDVEGVLLAPRDALGLFQPLGDLVRLGYDQGCRTSHRDLEVPPIAGVERGNIQWIMVEQGTLEPAHLAGGTFIMPLEPGGPTARTSYGLRDQEIHRYLVPDPDSDRSLRLVVEAGAPHAMGKVRCLGEQVWPEPEVRIRRVCHHGEPAVTHAEVDRLSTHEHHSPVLLSQGLQCVQEDTSRSDVLGRRIAQTCESVRRPLQWVCVRCRKARSTSPSSGIRSGPVRQSTTT